MQGFLPNFFDGFRALNFGKIDQNPRNFPGQSNNRAKSKTPKMYSERITLHDGPLGGELLTPVTRIYISVCPEKNRPFDFGNVYWRKMYQGDLRGRHVHFARR